MYECVGPEDWQESSVFNLAHWKNGLAFKNIDFSTAGRPVIKIAELKNGVAAQTARTMAEYDPLVLVQPGDMLFSWSGNPDTSIDVFRWEGEEGWLNQHIFKVTPGKGVSADFLFFLLKWLKPRFAEIARNKQTTGLGHVTIQDLRRMSVGIPESDEQSAIVGIIGPIQDKIELNRRMNETQEAMARAIFKDWFVDFGPTHAKMEGRTPYLAADIWSLFPDNLGADGKPEDWNDGALSDVASLNPESWSRANYPGTVDYVDLSNTKWGTIEAITPFTSDIAPSRAQRILRPGDTIVGTVRPGNGSYAFVSAHGLTGSTGFAVLRPFQDIYREAVHLAATSAENISRLAHLADGGAYPAVRPELVAATELVTASECVFSAFSSATSGLIDRAEANKRENRTLAATRDFLLPKLMSGEVRVKDAEKLVGEAI